MPEQLESQLKDWKGKIDSLKQKAEQKGGGYIEHYAEELEKLSQKYDMARYKLTLLKKGGSGALGDLREGFENAFEELKKAVNKARGKF